MRRTLFRHTHRIFAEKVIDRLSITRHNQLMTVQELMKAAIDGAMEEIGKLPDKASPSEITNAAITQIFKSAAMTAAMNISLENAVKNFAAAYLHCKGLSAEGEDILSAELPNSGDKELN